MTDDADALRSEMGEMRQQAESYKDYVRKRRQGLADDPVTGKLTKLGALPPKPEFFDSENKEETTYSASSTLHKRVGKEVPDELKSTSTEEADASFITNTIVNSDGTKTIQYEDGAQALEKDERIVQIQSPASGDPPERTTREFGYNLDGTLNYVKNTDGSEWHRVGQGREWTNTDGVKWTGIVSIDAESGIVFWIGEDSGEFVTQYSDGSQIVENEDGSKISQTPSGSVISVVYPDQSMSDFRYVNDVLVEVNLADGATLTTDDGVTWTNAATGKSEQAAITVDNSGMCIIARPNGDMETVAPSGEITVCYADGRQEKRGVILKPDRP